LNRPVGVIDFEVKTLKYIRFGIGISGFFLSNIACVFSLTKMQTYMLQGNHFSYKNPD